MRTQQSVKQEYSEIEAAAALALSIEELRLLVRKHILRNADAHCPHPDRYLASEVIVLKIIAAQPASWAASR